MTPVAGSPPTCTTPACGRRAIAGGRCRRCYSYTARHTHPPDLASTRVGDPAGHGEYGRMTRQQDSALCHECGGWYASVATHARAAHGLSADEYRRQFGLARRQPLVSLGMSAAASAHSRTQIGSVGWQRLEARRDPVAASRTRGPELRQPRPPVAEKWAAQAAVRAAGQAQEHLCIVCSQPIPQWRGAADNRRLCGRPDCRDEANRRSSQASGATRAARGRPLTDDDRDRLRSLAGVELATAIRVLNASGVRLHVIAAALGVSVRTVGRRARR